MILYNGQNLFPAITIIPNKKKRISTIGLFVILVLKAHVRS